MNIAVTSPQPQPIPQSQTKPPPPQATLQSPPDDPAQTVSALPLKAD